MSGDIFQPMENPDESSQSGTRNPLLCYLCNEPYEEPCMFGCFHSFCSRCLHGRATEGKMSCPICGYVHTLKEGMPLPPLDLLLKFMVESSAEERAQCANCDSTAAQMFFCNTCTQPLCGQCREETHRAKMFSSHDMVLLTKRAREVHKKCSLHEEPYIMFSSEKKIMLCINCFRDMRIESRGHCLDLETAYKQSCKKLDLRVQAFRDLQNSVRDGVLLFKTLLDEIKVNADKERTLIESLYASLLDKLAETKVLLLHKVDSQFTEKETAFRSQLKSLSALLPTLHVHLVISSAFSGSANKFEFLGLAYVLIERLNSIIQKQYPLHPTQSGQIDTAHKSEFFKSIEPLLYVPMQRSTLTATASSSMTAITTGTSCPGSPVAHRVTPNHLRRPNGLNGAKVKFIDAKGQFAEHCREFENAHRDLLQRFEQMKTQCQELQRDLTMRRCLARRDDVLKLGSRIENVQNQLESHYNTLEQKIPLLEKHWEESLERINNEQDLYQAQIQDVVRLKHESQHLKVVASQLTSFVSSIAAVTERLAPKLGQSNQTLEQEQNMSSLLEEISLMQPDSQQRVDAIRGAEEERQTNLANRTNPMDTELIKTKGLLRAPSLRDLKGGDRKKRLEKDDGDNSMASLSTPCLQGAGEKDTISQPSRQDSCPTKSNEHKRLSLTPPLPPASKPEHGSDGQNSSCCNLEAYLSCSANGRAETHSTNGRAETYTVCSVNGHPETHSANGHPETHSANGHPETHSVNGHPETHSANGHPETHSVNGHPETHSANGHPETHSANGRAETYTICSVNGHPETHSANGHPETHSANGHPEDYASLSLESSVQLTPDAESAATGVCAPKTLTSPEASTEHQKQLVEKRPRRTREGTQKKDKMSSLELDSREVRRNFLKDVENFKKKEPYSSPTKVASNGGSPVT